MDRIEDHLAAEALDATASVLMFSGGRDSTLAALRLASGGDALTLVTITSDHLLGIASVRLRLRELRSLIPATTRWLRIAQPKDLATDTSFYAQTCLPCHHAYVVVAAAIARNLGASRLAFGYASYQSDWPEQTPLAISRLTAVLAEFGITLDLPVLNLSSIEEAKEELVRFGVSPDSLEQKCSRQVTNVKLDDAHLAEQVELWEQAIRRSLSALHAIPTPAVEELILSEI
jgi:hypothetical protein